MLSALRKRIEENEEGFTLIELMVVVLIIGILVAIAVPTFLKAQLNAKGKAAESNIRSGLSAGKTVYADKQTYLDVDAATTLADFKTAEPSLGFQTAASTGPEQISMATTTNVLGLAIRSKAGYCYYIVDDVTAGTGGTSFGKSNATAATCTASTSTTIAGATVAASQTTAGW